MGARDEERSTSPETATGRSGVSRRGFLAAAGAAAAVLGTGGAAAATEQQAAPAAAPSRRARGDRILNAYYLLAHTYTCVPRHVRDDMRRMAANGTTTVNVSVLEQDLDAAVANIDIICGEAERAGLEVFATPARWGGIVAGAPKVPSIFTETNTDTWLYQNGQPYLTDRGHISDWTHPATQEFFRESLTTLLMQWPITGITWDEPKGTFLNEPGAVDFFGQMSAHAKAVNPAVEVGLFLQANDSPSKYRPYAAIPELDYFGCDGRPWRLEDGGTLQAGGKVLLPNAEGFIAEARANGKGGLMLIENHDLRLEDNELMQRRIREVAALGAEQLIYYYYPRNLVDPEANMQIVYRGLRGYARG